MDYDQTAMDLPLVTSAVILISTPAGKKIVTHIVIFLNALNKYTIPIEEECL
jgi:hypothetical protein